MAVCSQCRKNISLKLIFLKPLKCPSCQKSLTFDRKEYRSVSRPGLYIAIAILYNVRYTLDPVVRFMCNVALLLLWAAFTVRYIRYLKYTELKEVE